MREGDCLVPISEGIERLVDHPRHPLSIRKPAIHPRDPPEWGPTPSGDRLFLCVRTILELSHGCVKNGGGVRSKKGLQRGAES